MFEIESIVQTFTVLDTGKEISFGYSSAEEQECFKDVNGGDLILGYYNEPIDAVKILFEVKGHLEDTQIELVKKLEVKDGVCITSDIADDLRQKKLISIYKEKFDEIYEQMLRKQESGENADLEEEFRDYLKNVRELTNIRQVDELKKWSDILYGDGVISKNVYSITSYAEYAEIEDIIRNSSRYAIYKMEQKEKSPQSGLASDQGLTNYGKFLKYREENQKGNEKREERVTGFEIEKLNFTAPKLPVPQNYLVFGAPGTGKSHEVKELQESYFPDKNSYERVTFYSNYSYPNFVGTYKPKMEGKDIVYSYVPGPFIRILEKAYRNPDKNYLLVIEEINRANPAAAFGDIFQLLDRIQRELDIQFNDRKKILLKTMYTYISHRKAFETGLGISMFGTNSFNLVWERVCAYVFDNQLNVKLNELKQIPNSDYFDTESKTLIEVIERPKWRYKGTNYLVEQSKTLTPDLISIYPYKDNFCFAILDAKYYLIKLTKHSIEGNPGVGDVTKQYLYQLAYQDFIDKSGFKYIQNPKD